MDNNSIIVYVLCLIAIGFICKIFIKPIKFIIKLLINSIIGAILIYVINIVGTYCGFHIGINLITSIIVGLLGVPGAILLILFSTIL